ncbi:7-O-carbamoyltransferase [Geobacteraceae bacterium]|nr:7-O-carbamoyltransferase [Geobacteraceae bacterium]
MISLGINYGSHESSVAIVKEGKLVFAAAEERYTRIKQDSAFPVNAIKAAFMELDIDAQEVDVVSLSWPLKGDALLHDAKLFVTGGFGRTRSRAKKLAAQLLSSLNAQKKFQNLYRSFFPPPQNGFVFADHHAAHALSTFCLAEQEASVCVVFDGRGTTEATTIWKFENGHPRKLFERSFPDSIGVLYANATRLLGFRPLSDEWKVMGLAAYGRPNVDLDEFVLKRGWETTFAGRHFLPANDNEPSGFERRFAEYGRKGDGEIAQPHMDFAASVQRVCEEAMISYVAHSVALAGTADVCLAGGVALNCKANGEILRLPFVKSLVVQPAAGDDGTAIGAAFAGSIKFGVPFRRDPSFTPYLGTSYGDDEIESVLKRAKVRYERPENFVEDVATCLAADRLVGWFQGRMEFGPRALGHRSILASPIKVENRDRVNEAVKFREIWRPFAPAVMHEHGARYFQDYRMSPYMILSFWASEHARLVVPAVVHADGSCRVQSVTADNNPLFHSLLDSFSKRTGVHVLMNTSFNLKGEPIVESPLDALRTFYSSGLDVLAIGPFVVRK